MTTFYALKEYFKCVKHILSSLTSYGMKLSKDEISELQKQCEEIQTKLSELMNR